MSAWGDSELLVELLDRQFGFLLALRGTSQIVGLHRLVAFIQREPHIAGLLDDLRVEADTECHDYDKADEAIRDQLTLLWADHGAEIRRRLAHVTDGALHSYGQMDRFEADLAVRRAVDFFDVNDGPERATEKRLRAFHHWWKWCNDIANRTDKPLEDHLGGLGSRLNRLLAVQIFCGRRLRERGRSLAWPAYARLAKNATATNPVPPDTDSDTAWATFPLDVEFASILARADIVGADGADGADVDAVYEAIEADAKLLHEELRLRIGSARSRLALVQRYAARCEAFDAERLRNECDENSGNAERLLTLDLARFLFDAGLPPLIDATVGGLRPDILHVLPTSLFYVEAKQYADDHPRSQLSKAYSQVWGTWGRLRKTYPSAEAFLVVFRRAGPWVELPSVIHHEGLKLYSVVADISKEAGSREKRAAIRMTADELRPQEHGAETGSNSRIASKEGA